MMIEFVVRHNFTRQQAIDMCVGTALAESARVWDRAFLDEALTVLKMAASQGVLPASFSHAFSREWSDLKYLGQLKMPPIARVAD